MLYAPPSGSTDPNAPYVGKNVAAGTQGSKVPPAAVEAPQRELVAVIAAGEAMGLDAPTGTDTGQLLKAVRSGLLGFFVGTGSPDAVAIAPSPAYAALLPGMRLRVKIPGVAASTTASPSLTVNGIVAPIRLQGGGAPAPGDVRGGRTMTFDVDDGGNARIVGQAPSEAASILHTGADTSQAANTIVIPAVTPGVTALADYQIYEIVPNNDVTGPTTVTIGTLSAVALTRRDGSPLQAGDGPKGQPFLAASLGGGMRRLGLSPSEVPPTSLIHACADTSTTPGTIVAAPQPSITAYARGLIFTVLTNAPAASGGTTANFGPGTRTVTRADGTPIQAGDYGALQEVLLIDDGGRLQLIGVTTSNLPSSTIIPLAAGSGTFTVPAGVTRLKRVRGWGAAGSAGGSTGTQGAGTGSCGGGYFEAYGIAVTPGQQMAYSVGAGGPTAPGDGTPGGATYLAGVGYAGGGDPGYAGINGPQGTTGNGGQASTTGPGLVLGGSPGGRPYGTAPFFGGIGGSSPFGGGTPGPTLAGAGFPGNFPGGGANGGSNGGAGGKGGDGLLLIEV